MEHRVPQAWPPARTPPRDVAAPGQDQGFALRQDDVWRSRAGHKEGGRFGNNNKGGPPTAGTEKTEQDETTEKAQKAVEAEKTEKTEGAEKTLGTV